MSYFVEGFDTNAKRALLIWAEEDRDPYDNWGWSMGWLFDIAGEMWNRDIDTGFLNYSPGIAGADVNPDRQEGLAEMSDSALVYAAKVLDKYTDLLDAKGESY